MRRELGMIVAMLLACPVAAAAHAVGVSRGEYRVEADEVRSDLVFARQELLTALPALDVDRDGALSDGELAAGARVVADWIGRGVAVRVAGGPCAARLEAARLTEQDGVEVAALHRCPAGSAVSIGLPLLADLSLGHRHIVTATSASRTVQAVLYEARPEVALSAPAGDGGPVWGSLFRLGVEHILTGWDHLLFLLAVVLVGGPLRSVLAVVTAFTLGHSVTLAAAALGVWTPSSRLVEPAIALSIAYVGVENLLVRDLRRRWRLTLVFGLVHGFGFAGALREAALSATQLPLALAFFNGGVEAGQLAVLAVVLPAIAWLAGCRWFARGGLQIASLAIAAMGIAWFAARVGG